MNLTGSAAVLGAELRQAARRLSRSPGFAVLAIGTLTVGIGINAAMFALMDALLFRPPPHVAAPDEVVRVQLRVEGDSGLMPRTHYPNVVTLRASGAFAAVAAYDDASVSIGFGSDAQLANAKLVSDEFFSVLRPAPRLGGLPAAGGEAEGGWTVISDGFWRRRFGGEPDIVGAELAIDGRVHTVVGVLPSGFPNLGSRAVDVWVSLDHAPAVGFVSPEWREDPEGWLAVVGRLAPGVGRDVAEQRATAVVEDRRIEFGEGDGRLAVSLVSIVPGRGADRSLESDVSRWLAGVSAVVLLIACANVCNLALLRLFARRREHFIRLALGASRWEFVRRSLCDTCLVVLPGAVGALLVSFLVRNGTAAFLSGQIPVSRQLWDARTAGILAVSAALAFVLVWAAGAVLHLRTAVADTGWAALAADRGRLGGGARRTLLAVQAALCFVLLAAAGLFAASLWRAESLDLGVELDRTIQLTVNFPPGPRTAVATRAAYERAAAVLGRHPGVERVVVTGSSPYRSGTAAAPWTDERGPAELWPPGRQPAYQSTVGAGFFSAVGAGSLRGRDFEEGDQAGAPLVAVVNEPLARHLWPFEDALGQCLWLEDAPTCVRVVGVRGARRLARMRRADLRARGGGPRRRVEIQCAETRRHGPVPAARAGSRHAGRRPVRAGGGRRPGASRAGPCAGAERESATPRRGGRARRRHGGARVQALAPGGDGVLGFCGRGPVDHVDRPVRDGRRRVRASTDGDRRPARPRCPLDARGRGGRGRDGRLGGRRVRRRTGAGARRQPAARRRPLRDVAERSGGPRAGRGPPVGNRRGCRGRARRTRPADQAGESASSGPGVRAVERCRRPFPAPRFSTDGSSYLPLVHRNGGLSRHVPAADILADCGAGARPGPVSGCRRGPFPLWPPRASTDPAESPAVALRLELDGRSEIALPGSDAGTGPRLRQKPSSVQASLSCAELPGSPPRSGGGEKICNRTPPENS